MGPTLALAAALLSASCRAEVAGAPWLRPFRDGAAELLAGADVILFGETHNDPETHRLVEEVLPALRRGGATVLGVEAPYDLQGRSLESLERLWTDPSFAEPRGINPAAIRSWISLMRAARGLGMKVVFMDARAEEKERWHREREGREPDPEGLHRLRRRVMAGALSSALSSAGGKAAALVGAAHGEPGALPEALRERGLKAVSIRVWPYQEGSGEPLLDQRPDVGYLIQLRRR